MYAKKYCRFISNEIDAPGLSRWPTLFGVVCSLCFTAAASEPKTTGSESGTILQASQSMTGVNTRLKATQHAHIKDEATWRRVRLAHLGVINGSPAVEELPVVDFAQSTVIAIVEDAHPKTQGIRLNRIALDDEIVFFDYEPIDGSEKQKPPAENVFGFFVIPRSEYEIVLRRAKKQKSREGSQQRFHEVTRFPAATPDRQAAHNAQSSGRMLNIEFVHDAGAGNYDGVVGSPNDLWNLVTVGTTAVDFMRYSDASPSTARIRISRHDGAWGIAGQRGIFHGYIYHNCRCVDLEVTILDLPGGNYRAYVYAHGDAPDQNAKIELKIGELSVGKKATANNGTWRFRSYPFVEGVQYVTFEFDTHAGDDVRFISHRDGSDYSMFNAIQIVPINRP